jgi:uncharacterized membrane-anchored protein
MIPTWHGVLLITLLTIHTGLLLWMIVYAFVKKDVPVYIKLIFVCLLSTLPAVVGMATLCVRAYMAHKIP